MRGTIGRVLRRGWTMGTAGVVVAVAFAGGLFSVAADVIAATGAAPTLIVPGRSIGPAVLGMTMREAEAALGPAVVEGPVRRVYPRAGVAVDFDAGVAVRIWTAAPRYRTAAGAGVGIADTDAARLVGDDNSTMTISGHDTTVAYIFRGIGFVFRSGRAIEAFVEEPIALSPPPPSAAAPATPGAPPIVVPGGPPLPPAGSAAPANPASRVAPPTGASSAAAAAIGVALRDVSASVLMVGGLTVSGTVENTGKGPAGPFTVIASFTRASGDDVERRQVIQGPLAPGASAPFVVGAVAVADIIIRYQVAVVTEAGTLAAATAPASVPASAYATFAQRQIHVKIDLGAPFTGIGPPAVQVLVSVADTGAIPAQWVQQITVAVTYMAGGAAGSQTTELRPGETRTILVPAGATLGVPQVTAVVLNGQ